ncbi:hypothetical protein [Allorhizocola rhizosphaerae]|nr:hypothetical protein [Allorhizocola rhizosphaerae]
MVGVETVEFHLTGAFRRLDVSTRAELRRVVAGSAADGIEERSS